MPEGSPVVVSGMPLASSAWRRNWERTCVVAFATLKPRRGSGATART